MTHSDDPLFSSPALVWRPRGLIRLACLLAITTALALSASATAAPQSQLIRIEVAPSPDDAIIRFRATPSGHLRVRITKRLIHLEQRRHGRIRPLTARKGYRRPKHRPTELRILLLKSSVLVQLVDPKRHRTLAHMNAKIPEGSPLVSLDGSATLLTRRHPCSTPLKKPGLDVWVHAETAYEGFKRVDKMATPSLFRTTLQNAYRAACAGNTLREPTASPPWRWKDADYRTYGDTITAWSDLSRTVLHPDQVRALLQKWNKALPAQTRLETIGMSHERRPIVAMAISTGPQSSWQTKRSVFLNGAHHGNEPMSVSFVLDAAQRILEGLRKNEAFATHALEHTVLWIVPVVNPDGLHRFLEVSSHLGRKNGRDHGPIKGPDRVDGVDLNRNYPFRWGALGNRGSKPWKSSVYYRGPAAASEPEVQSIMALARRERFDWALTYHSGTIALLYCYTIDGVKNPRPNPNEQSAARLIDGLPEHPQGKPWAIRSNLYAVDGTDQDWHYHTHGTLALLVEGARSTPRNAKRRRNLLDAVWPIAERLFDGTGLPTSLELSILNDTGPADNVYITVDNVTVAGERWTPRARDGRLHVWLPTSGETTVRVYRDEALLMRTSFHVPATGLRRVIRLPDAPQEPAEGSGP